MEQTLNMWEKSTDTIAFSGAEGSPYLPAPVCRRMVKKVKVVDGAEKNIDWGRGIFYCGAIASRFGRVRIRPEAKRLYSEKLEVKMMMKLFCPQFARRNEPCFSMGTEPLVSGRRFQEKPSPGSSIKALSYKRLSPAKLKRFIKRRICPPITSDRVKQQWSIGIYEGTSLEDMRPSLKAKNPVLTGGDVTDVPGKFVADPFMLEGKDQWHMFFEVWNRARSRGEIGLASSRDGHKWVYEKMVLVEPFHLSYPYVFSWAGEHYMIPETFETRTVRLYKASEFPYEWELHQTLLSGMRFKDASIFRHDGLWWIFVETSPLLACDVLRLYSASDLHGPWVEHPQSPLVTGDARTARPAGRVICSNGRIFRFAQACDPIYGLRVHTFEVTELSRENYQEREVLDGVKLEGSGQGWNEGGMHHIDVHVLKDGSLLACVDGWLDSRARRRRSRFSLRGNGE